MGTSSKIRKPSESKVIFFQVLQASLIMSVDYLRLKVYLITICSKPRFGLFWPTLRENWWTSPTWQEVVKVNIEQGIMAGLSIDFPLVFNRSKPHRDVPAVARVSMALQRQHHRCK